MNNPVISILLPSFESKDLLSKVFLKSHINSDITELIIYDNGGNDFTEEFKEDVNAYGKNNLDFWKCVRINDTSLKCHTMLLGDGKNIGLHAAYNECFKYAKGDWFYLPHSDMVLLKNWDVELLNATRGMVLSKLLLCSRSVEPTQGHTRHHKILDFGKSVEEFKEKELMNWYDKEYKDSQESRRIEVGARMPMFLHRSLLDKMTDFNQKNNICDGPFDDHYFSYCQDDDIIQTSWHLGVRRFHMVWGSLVYHLSGQSNKQQNIDRDSDDPYIYFMYKWAKWYPDVCRPGQYHPKLISFETRVR